MTAAKARREIWGIVGSPSAGNDQIGLSGKRRATRAQALAASFPSLKTPFHFNELN
jgi:hypothetical protein